MRARGFARTTDSRTFSGTSFGPRNPRSLQVAAREPTGACATDFIMCAGRSGEEPLGVAPAGV